MPNGGSDCCGTCWFNAHNKGKPGYDHADDPEPHFCTIRGLAIENAFWTYCGNHPHRRPTPDPIPIGPVMVGTGGYPYGREIWQPSPDTAEIRQHLLDLLAAIVEQPTPEYPAAPYSDEVVVWQLGEFREPRAVAELERVAAFNPAASEDKFHRTRARLVESAKSALEKIAGSSPDSPTASQPDA